MDGHWLSGYDGLVAQILKLFLNLLLNLSFGARRKERILELKKKKVKTVKWLPLTASVAV